MSGNRIASKGGRILFENLDKILVNLRELDVSDNKIGNSCINSVLRYLKN